MLYKKLSVMMAVFMTVSLILSACATPTAEVIEKVVTQVVKETVIVAGTPQVVEKEVTRLVEQEVKEQPPVVLIQEMEVASLDPLRMHMVEENPVRHLFDTFTKWDENMAPLPGIVTEWKMVDELTWEFKIRQGVKAHNGEVIDAEDIKYSLDRVVDPNIDVLGTPAWAFGNIKYDHSEVIDTQTIRITTEIPVPDMVYFMIDIYVVPKDYYSTTPLEELSLKPVGTGAYKLAEPMQPDRLVMEANEDYWGGAPEIKHLIWRAVPEASSRLAELNTGAADLIVNVPPDLGPQIDPAYAKILTQQSMAAIYIGFVFYNEPAFLDKRVRQAFNYGHDFQKIIDNVLGGNGQRTYTFAKAPSFQHPDLEPYPFDPEKGRQLMKEAGYEDRDGDGVVEDPDGRPLVITMQTPKGRYVKGYELAQAVAADLNENLGVHIEVEVTETGLFYDAFPECKLTGGLFFIGSGSGYTCLGDISDFYGEANWCAGGWSRTESGMEFDRRFTKYVSTLDPEQRVKDCYDLQEYMYEEVPLIFLYFQVQYWGVSNRLDWTPGPKGSLLMYKAKFK